MWQCGLACLISFKPPQPESSPFFLGAEWQEDAFPAVKELFWETGCNFARLSGGGYGWVTDTHKRALKELGEHGVKVLLQLGSHYPDASFFDLKESYLTDQDGKTGTPSRQTWAITYKDQTWPQYSYASQTFREKLRDSFKSYFAGLGSLEDVDAVMVHNEPGYFWVDDAVFDYSPSSTDWFRHWLQSQYLNVARLNTKWGKDYSSFAQVEPPRELPPAGNRAAWMDWRRGNVAEIQDFLLWEKSLAKTLAPGLPVTTNLPGPLDNWYPIHLSDNYRFSSGLDISSVDIYPGADYTSKFFPGYATDMTRSIAPGHATYIAECESYAPEHFPKLSDEQRAQRLAGDLWTYIGHGANAISLWTWNGEDGFKLTHGEFNARIATVRDTAYMAKMLDLGSFHRQPSSVALVVDRNSFLVFQGTQNARASAQTAYAESLGLYGALRQAGFATDVISADQVRSGAGHSFKALVLAAPKTMDSALAEQLTQFVRDGGLLITDSSIASEDSWGNDQPARPAFGLDAVCGLKVESIDTGHSAHFDVNGNSFEGSATAHLTLEKAKTLSQFADGSPSVTQNNFEKGHVVVLASVTGDGNSLGDQPGLSKALSAWIKTYSEATPAVRKAEETSFVDTGVLTDSRGNELIVATQPINGSGAIPTLTNIKFDSLTKLASKHQNFLLTDQHQDPSRILSGPKLVGEFPIALTSFTSHAQVLSATNHSPLLATDSPRFIKENGVDKVIVTVYNPSPLFVKGELQLKIPARWKTQASTEITLAPYASKQISINLTVDDAIGRHAVRATLNSKGKLFESLPFDIQITAKT